MNGSRACQVLKPEDSPCGCQGAGDRKVTQSPLVRENIAQIPRVLVPEAAKKKLPLKLPSGDQSAVEPPGPIPNPEVKRRSANGSETIGLVRVGRRQVYARLL